MDILLQDIRYAIRKLARTPGFTLIAVATLALAIGATTAVFSIVNGVLFRPLPFRDPDGIVAVGSVGKSGTFGSMSAPDFLDYQAQNHSLSGMAALNDGNGNLTLPGAPPARLTIMSAGARFFDLLGVTMQLGRGFATGEDKVGAPHVVVLSDQLWRATFNADARIVGKPITIDGSTYTVIGVAPRGVAYPHASDVWVPFAFEDWMIDPQNRGAHFLMGVGRVKPGMTADAAKRDIAAIAERLRAEYPRSNATIHATAVPMQERIVGNVRTTLFTMLGAVGFVLLIACANVANLLLVRASTRETEIAVRTALGAGRGRIVRQLITESVLLSLAGAAFGGALAAWAVDAVVAFGPRGLPRLADIAIDWRVLVFAVALSVVTGVLFGLVPALHAARAELAQMLREGVRGSSARRGTNRTRGALVVAEMALAVVLLVGAGLLIRSFQKLVNVDPGFRPEQVVTFNVAVPDLRYPFDRNKNQFADQVVAALRQLPGSQAAGVALSRPMQDVGMRTSFDVDGRPPAAADARMLAAIRPVSADYFRALGIPLVRGRLFDAHEERFGPPPVVVVSQAFVTKYFPNENPIGKHITLGISHDTAAANRTPVDSKGEIVGIVGDVKQRELKETPDPAVYLPHGTFPENDMAFVVRSTADIASLGGVIRKRVAEIDPEMPIYDMQTMETAVSQSVAQPRFYTLLLAAFAGLALLLAALGIYGVISYTVSQRTRELGIRIALGATNDRVVRLVLGQGLGLTVAGVVVGIAGAAALMQLLSKLLFGVQATDAVTFAAVPVVLLGVAVIASYLPARRAARVDPVIAMRAE